MGRRERGRGKKGGRNEEDLNGVQEGWRRGLMEGERIKGDVLGLGGN